MFLFFYTFFTDTTMEQSNVPVIVYCNSWYRSLVHVVPVLGHVVNLIQNVISQSLNRNIAFILYVRDECMMMYVIWKNSQLLYA